MGGVIIRKVLRAAMALLLVGMLVGCDSGTSQTRAPVASGPADRPASGSLAQNAAVPGGQNVLTLGPPVELAQGTVPADGGRIDVQRAGDPLNGLSVDVPAGSYDGTTAFAISYAPITELRLGEHVKALTPLISIDNGGGYAKEYMALTIPIEITEDQFAMAFYYDKATGELEGLTTAALERDAITVLATHFSELLITATDKARLDKLKKDTKFVEGQDDWNFPNYGSILSPGGICQGMCLTEMWYFENEKPITGEMLPSQNVNGLGTGRETPHFWPDDSWSIKLASMVQKTVEPRYLTLSGQVAHSLRKMERPTVEATGREYLEPRNRVQFYSFALALETTGKPQVMVVYKEGHTDAHALVCYKIEGRRLYVEDPNHVGPKPGQGYVDYVEASSPLADGKFTEYETAVNSKEWEEGRRVKFPEIQFSGRSSWLGNEAMERYWRDSRSDLIGRVAYIADSASDRLVESRDSTNTFPDYALRITERDDRGARLDEYELDRLGGAKVGTRNVEIAAASSTPLDLYIYRFEDVQQWEKSYTPGRRSLPTRISNGKVTLRQGDNLLGFHLESSANGGWAGFDWITITYEPATPTPAATGAVKSTPRPGLTPGRAPTPASTGSPAFTVEDCERANVLGESYTAKGRVTGSSLLDCEYGWTSPSSRFNSIKLHIAHISQTATSVSGGFTIVRDGTIKESQKPACEGLFETLEDTDSRYTAIRGPDPKCGIGNCCPSATGWYAVRVVLYKDGVYWIYYNAAKDAGSRADALRALDAVEACAKGAIDRYEFEAGRNR